MNFGKIVVLEDSAAGPWLQRGRRGDDRLATTAVKQECRVTIGRDLSET